MSSSVVLMTDRGVIDIVQRGDIAVMGHRLVCRGFMSVM
jgi:hypothetical protein